jgi:hypothetical protein
MLFMCGFFIEAQNYSKGGNHMKILNAAWVAVFVIALAGCGGMKTAGKPDSGTVTNGNYSNVYFGMTMSLPKDWHVQDQKSAQDMMKRGGKVIAGDNKEISAAVDSIDQTTVNLFTVFEKEVGAPVLFNPSIVAIAENVSQTPGIKTGNDYLFHAKKLLQQGQLKFKFTKEPYPATLGGKTFDVMEMELAAGQALIKQKYYVAVVNGYALSLVQSHIDDEQLKPLDASFQTIQFK